MAKKRLRISGTSANHVHVASIISRIFTPLDRIPAPLAFGVTSAMGAFQAYLLLRDDVDPSMAWYARVAPFVAFGSMVLMAVFLIASSRPVVVHRDTGPLVERRVVYMQYFGMLATWAASASMLLTIPALLVTGKFSDKLAQATNSSKSIASAAPAQSPPAASAAPTQNKY